MLGMRLDYQNYRLCFNTYQHRKSSNSLLFIFLNRVSLKALTRAYSAMPSWIGIGSKLPIQPRRRHSSPFRVSQVTNNGLNKIL
jgi:hypothetical protein